MIPSSSVQRKEIKINLVVVLLFALLFAFDFYHPFLYPFEQKILDTRFQLRGAETPDSPIVIVEIDQKSMDALGSWPWPRSHLAQFTDILAQSGARVVGFDIIYAEEEHNLGMQAFQELVDQYKNLEIDSLNTNTRIFFQMLMDMAEGLNNDQRFAYALEQAGNVVLPLVFENGRPEPQEKTRDNETILNNINYTDFKAYASNPKDARYFPFPKGESLILPISDLSASALALAHVNAFPDADGGLRWEHLFMEYRDRWFPSFSLMLALLYQQTESIGLVLGQAVYLNNTAIPMDEEGRMLIDYWGPPGTFKHVSFSDVVQGKLEPDVFQDKLVLVGSTLAGLHDSYATPFSGILPGVEKHANVIQNILDQRFLHRSQSSRVIDLATLVLLGITLALLFPRFKILGSTLLFVITLPLYFFAIQYAFETQLIWINSILPMAVITALFASSTLVQYQAERKEKAFVKSAFSQYLAPAVVNQLMANPGLLKLGGERKTLTAFFSDVARFSTVSERLQPEELVDLLNHYLTNMTDILLACEGTVDKYEGDAIIAFFGAPIPSDKHAVQACFSAIEMQNRLETMRTEWEKTGQPLLRMRIGINTGPMVVGNMGSKTRMDYTIMGDSVNLAARLEGLNKQYQTETMISEFTWQQAHQEVETRELDSVRVVGKREPVRVYELLARKGGLTDEMETVLALFNEGLACYKKRHWQEACDLFEDVLSIKPDDGPSLVYVERCKEFLVAPPPPEWDGVFSATSK